MFRTHGLAGGAERPSGEGEKRIQRIYVLSGTTGRGWEKDSTGRQLMRSSKYSIHGKILLVPD